MSAKTPSTVILRSSDEFEYREAPAAAAIRPGMLIERAGGQVRPHATAAERTAPLFAIERRARGMVADDTRADVNAEFDTYGAGEFVLYVRCDGGEQMYGLLAPGAAVTEGQMLVSNGTGAFRPPDAAVAAENANDAVVEAVEDVDNAAGADPVRVRVEVL